MNLTLCPTQCKSPPHAHSPQHGGRSFKNPKPVNKLDFAGTLRVFRDFLFNKPANTVPSRPVPVKPITRVQLDNAPDGSLFRLGHSTILLKLRGEFWLTDPVFAERASPLRWMGPKRFHAPPIALEDLPPLRAVILSHDHYDHLDYHAVRALAAKTSVFLTPLGVGDTLVEWGIEANKVRQLDWWQGTDVAGIRFVATPSQHFSGRGLFDGNRTLWASWVILDGDLRVFFSGDSGYFDGFKTIGDKYGPFDLTLMETGAYNANWPDIHMRPEETLQAHLDLRGRWLLPIHNGTFDLAMHAWHDPFERISALSKQHGVALTTPMMGEMLNLQHIHVATQWWRELMPVADSTLLSYITQRWDELLFNERLEIDLQLAAQRVRCEIFVGEEFSHGGTRHVDVVVKSQLHDSASEHLPTVLVFEKHSARLIQQELHGLQLETPVLFGY